MVVSHDTMFMDRRAGVAFGTTLAGYEAAVLKLNAGLIALTESMIPPSCQFLVRNTTCTLVVGANQRVLAPCTCALFESTDDVYVEYVYRWSETNHASCMYFIRICMYVSYIYQHNEQQLRQPVQKLPRKMGRCLYSSRPYVPIKPPPKPVWGGEPPRRGQLQAIIFP